MIINLAMNHPFYNGITVKPVHRDLKRNNFKGKSSIGNSFSNDTYTHYEISNIDAEYQRCNNSSKAVI